MPILTLSEPSMWLIVLATAVVAGFIRGFTGFGGPAIMILVLVQFYAPVSVLTKVGLVDLISNMKLLPNTVHEVDWRVTVCMILSSLAGAPFGVFALLEIDPTLIRRTIAIVAALGTMVMLAGWRLKAVPPLWVHAVVGFLGGAVLGATFIALIVIVFMFASPASAAVSRANVVHWMFFVGMAIIASYIWTGVLTWTDLWRSLFVGAIYLLGAVLGSALFRSTTERGVRKVVLWLLLGLSGMALVGS
jgi:uncharacterized membrane protein YfcA